MQKKCSPLFSRVLQIRADGMHVFPAEELAIYLDDLFHELAGFGQEVELMPGSQ